MVDVLPSGFGVAPEFRIRVLRLLSKYQPWEQARENEAVAHAISSSTTAYTDKMRQLIYNVRFNPSLRPKTNLALLSDRELARGTVIEDIETESAQRCTRFEQILTEKYELVSRSVCKSALRCRRCGNQDIVCEQKQTRGADEAMTVFCTCTKCSNRWTMR